MATRKVKVVLEPDTTKLDKALKTKSVGAGVGGAKQGTDDVVKATEENTSTLEKLVGFTKKNLSKVTVVGLILSSFAGIAKPVFDILRAFGAIFLQIMRPLLIPALKILVTALKGWADLAPRIAAGLEAIVGFLTNIVEFAVEWIVQPILDSMVRVFTALAGVGRWIFDNIIIPAFSFLFEAGKWLFDTIKSGFQAIPKIASFIFDLVKGLFTGKINVLTEVWGFLKGFFTGFIDAGSMVWGFIKTLFSGAIDVVKSVWSFIKSLFGGRGSIEGRARGGPVTGGTPFVVGERGPELFVPGRSGNIVPNNQLNGGGGSVSIVNNIQATINSDIDIDRFGKRLADAENRELARRTNTTRL